jgi:hypothetical protein
MYHFLAFSSYVGGEAVAGGREADTVMAATIEKCARIAHT